MWTKRRFGRVVALMATGGCLLQATGCAAGLVPAYASLAESTVLRLLLTAFLGI